MNRFYLIFKFLFDKNIPIKEKWWIILPLIYIVSPIDLIPAPVLGLSIIDDAVVILYLLSVINGKTKKYYGNAYKNDEGQKNQQENIVDNVEYEIKDDEDEQ